VKFAVVVPAAGVGKRFGPGIPKQYRQVAGLPLICHTLSRLLAVTPERIVVAVSDEDDHWRRLPDFRHDAIRVVSGGPERAISVLHCLEFLATELQPADWVLVHDVARPCVTREDIQLLVNSLADHPVGGILAAPVADTLKRVGAGQAILGTEDRSQLWAAMTPQMFRFGLLKEAVEVALAAGVLPTDESSAVERLGLVPKVVMGRRDNLKLTRPEDLAIIEAVLLQQAAASRRCQQQQEQQ